MKPTRITWRPRLGFIPNAAYNGDNGDYIFSGSNLWVRGDGDLARVEGWKGNYDISETITATTLTGTFATTSGSTTIAGTSTLMLQELIPGQLISLDNQLYQVYSIASNTSMQVTYAPAANASGLTGTVPHIIMDVDAQRGTLARGSIQRFASGSIVAVGQGAVRLNGVTVPPSGLTANKRLQLGVLDAATGNYSVYKLGMSTPTLTTVAATGGGTKNMQAGTYSVRIVPSRLATGGWNNPSNKVEVTITAGQRIQITFPAMDTTSGQDAWDIYVTKYSTGAGIQGPWYFYTRINTAHVASGGGNYTIEYNDGEIGDRILEFNNDPPPDATFVSTLAGVPVLIGTNGAGRKLDGTAATTATVATVAGTSTTWLTDIARGQAIYIAGELFTVTAVASDTSMTVDPAPRATASGLTVQLGDTAPGPALRIAKPNNPEAFPASYRVAVSPAERIIGFTEGNGRIFLLTENRLHMATLSGSSLSPLTVRPFWRTGFRNPQACVFVNGQLYGFTKNGATRSVADGDEIVEEHEFASPVSTVMAPWQPERVFVAYDPRNAAVLFIHSNDNTNSSGYYYSTVLAYDVRNSRWHTLFVISSDSGHRTVTGVATVSGDVYMLVSGKIYQWDTGSNSVAHVLATPFVDLGEEGFDKTVRGMGLTAYSTSTIAARIFKASAQENIEYGTAAGGPFLFTPGSAPQQTEYAKMNVRKGRLLACTVDLNSSGGNIARLDEIYFDVSARGVRY